MANNSIITKVTGTDTSTNRIASTFYGTCGTAAGTAEKAVTLSDSCVFNDSCLVTGVTVHVKFTYSNSHATPTLKVGTATAKQIMAYGTTKAGTTATASWYAGSVVSFTYDGTYWIMNDYKTDTDTKVTQTATSTNSNYEVLFSNSANNTTETAGARKNNNLTFNPSSGTLDCTATGTNLKSAIRSDVRVELTQAQYDALVTTGTVDPNIIYLITDTSSVMSATDVSYDNVGRGLSATNVQGAIDALCYYSTSEHCIGTWIDGKPIYEITIKIDNPQYNTTDYVDATTINNVDVCISTSSIWYRTLSSNLLYYSAVGTICPEKGSTSYQLGTRFRKDTSKVQYLNVGYNQQIQTVWITVQYTKTTD